MYAVGRKILVDITLQDLLSHRDRKVQVDVAILDFNKAFDTVPHSRLLGKLEYYGIDVVIYKWVSAFLNNREQRVVVNGSYSTPRALRWQGSEC